MTKLTKKRVREIAREEIIKHLQRHAEIAFPPANLDELKKLDKLTEIKEKPKRERTIRQ